MRSAVFVMLVSLTVAACGGKIADDPNAPRGTNNASSGGGAGDPGTSATPATPEQAAQPFGTPPSGKASVEDACGTICARNGQCGAYQTDCLQHCADDIHAASACASPASAYIHCYADNLEGCAALPPVCEDAYCAYTRCAGKVVPTYCR